MEIITYILNRLKEGSTWAGIAALAAGVGIHITPEHMQVYTQFGVGLSALLAMMLQEGGK